MDFKSAPWTLVDAFVPPEEDEKEPPPSQSELEAMPRIMIRNATGISGRVDLIFEHMNMRLRDVDFREGDVFVLEGRADVFVEELDVPKGWMRLTGPASPVADEAVEVSLRETEIRGYAMEKDEFILGEFHTRVGDSALSLEGQLSWWDTEGVRFWTDAQVRLAKNDPVFERLLGGQLRGESEFVFSGGGEFLNPSLEVEVSSPELSIAGVQFENLTAGGILAFLPTGGIGAQLNALEADFGGGRVGLQDGQINTADGTFEVTASLNGLSGMQTLEDVGVAAETPYLPTELTGGLQVDGTWKDGLHPIDTLAEPFQIRLDDAQMGAFNTFSLMGALRLAGRTWPFALVWMRVSSARGARLLATGLWDSREGWNGQVAVDGLTDTLSEFACSVGGQIVALTATVTGRIPNLARTRLRIEGARIDAVDLGIFKEVSRWTRTPPGSGT